MRFDGKLLGKGFLIFCFVMLIFPMPRILEMVMVDILSYTGGVFRHLQ
jgi:hypothetical protein